MTTKKTEANPTPEEIAAAHKEGVLDRVKEAATTQEIDTLKGEEPENGQRFFNTKGTNQLEELTDLGLEGLKAAIDPKKPNPLPEEDIANLLVLERNGKNRTDFVNLLIDRLKIKDLSTELPHAGGPDYTNDVSAVTKL